MAISYLGWLEGGSVGGTGTFTTTFAGGGLTTDGGTDVTLQQGDLLIVLYAAGSSTDLSFSPPSGYSSVITEIYENNINTGGCDTNVDVWYKFMGATPDTNIILPKSGNNNNACTFQLYAFRGVDQGTPFDVTPTTAAGTATGRPTPPAITPTTSGSVIWVAAGAAQATGADFSNSDLTSFHTDGFADIIDAVAGAGYKTWTSGTFTPAAWTGNTTASTASWAAVSVALRPLTSQSLTPSLYTNSQTFYSPTVSVGAVNLAPSLYTNSQAFYSPTVSVGAVNLTPSLYTNADTTFYSATVSQGGTQSLTASLYTNSQTFYSPTATYIYGLTAGFFNTHPELVSNGDFTSNTTGWNISNGSAASVSGKLQLTNSASTCIAETTAPIVSGVIYQAQLDAFLSPDSDATQAVFRLSSTLGGGEYFDKYPTTTGTYSYQFTATGSTAYIRVGNAAPSTSGKIGLYDNVSLKASPFYSPTVKSAGTLVPSFMVFGNTFYSHTLHTTYALTDSFYTNSQTFYSPTVSYIYSLSPALYTLSNVFYSPTVTPGAVTLSPSLFTNSATYYSATISGLYTLTPSLYTNSGTFYSATITVGAVTLSPSLFTNSQSYYSPTVAPGSVTLSPSLYTNSQTYYSDTLSGHYSLTASLYTNSQTYYTPVVTPGAVNLTPSLFTNSITFYSAAVTNGGVVLQAPYFVDSDTFYNPTESSTYTLSPALYTDSDTFYSPSEYSVYTLTPNLYTNTQSYYTHVITIPNKLNPSLYVNVTTFYSASIGSLEGITFSNIIVDRDRFYTPEIYNRSRHASTSFNVGKRIAPGFSLPIPIRTNNNDG